MAALLKPVPLDNIHRAKPPRIIISHHRPVREMEHHMVMLLRRRVVVVKFAQHLPRNQDATGHAKVNEQRLAGGQEIQRIVGDGVGPGSRVGALIDRIVPIADAYQASVLEKIGADAPALPLGFGT